MLGAIQTDLLTGFVSFLFTLLILSYLVGDNPAFRVAIHIFVGISAGYIAVVVFRQVLVNEMFLPMITGTNLERLLLAFPLVMSLLLLGKSSSQFDWMGRPVVAFLVGVGTASAVAGAVLGTLFPQVLAGITSFDVRNSLTLGNAAGSLMTGAFVLFGTIVTLVYFQFTVFGKNKTTGKRGYVIGFISLLGQVFIAITLGAIFAGVLAAALTALVDRIQSLVSFMYLLLSNVIS
jgi:cytochrome bd-type quinol oxidase subunit 2